MEGTLFESLTLASLHEITGRYPRYFDYYDVEAPPVETLVRRYEGLPSLEGRPTDELRYALNEGFACLSRSSVRVRQDCTSTDAISMLMIQSILDAYAAALDILDLQPPPRIALAEGLPIGYVAKVTASDVRYVIHERPGRTLLVIPATGTPLRIWSQLLNDRRLFRRCVVVQGRGSQIFEGGLPGQSRLDHDATDIGEVLESEGLTEIDILAWCNGARTALQIARAHSHRIVTITLLSPTFHGALGCERYPSSFEDNLANLYDILDGDDDMVEYAFRTLMDASRAEVASVPDDPDKRIRDVLRLPPREYLTDLMKPLSTLAYFKNYLDRIRDDAKYDVNGAIAGLRCPLLLLTGTHDAAINNQAAIRLMTSWGRRVQHVSILGGGHHMQVLQYPYFRYALNSFLAGVSPLRTARLEVEHLAATH